MATEGRHAQGHPRPQHDVDADPLLRLPRAKFTVEELVGVAHRTRTVDPFLRVEYKGARYYIHQWDEPGFIDS